MPVEPLPISEISVRLRERYGPVDPPPWTDPLDGILWENVAYLADDARRAEAFRGLRERVGTRPEQILAAPHGTLIEVARYSIVPERTAERLCQIAEVAIESFDGDLASVLSFPFRDARKALMRFPSVGEPGAEKILLLTRSHAVLAMDSNALRVLQRLGYGEETGSYGAQYRSTQRAVGSQTPEDWDRLIELHLMLRRHGQTVCRRNAPACEACPLADGCAYAAQQGT